MILEGLRVVDLTTGLAGPVATQLLAEAGAEVLKVERPGGDPVRGSQPNAFETWNRSKHGLVLDLDDPAGRARLEEILVGADVLVHELPPRQAQALGLDDEALAERFPRLIVCSVLGYPVGHSDAERAADEILVQARLGVMDEQLSHRDGPCFVRFPIASWPTAYIAAAGILTRLIVRQRTGRAGPVHTSLEQGLLAVMAMLWNIAEKPSPLLAMKIPLPKAMPFVVMTLFECQDGTWLQTLGGFMENPLVLESCAMLGEEPPDVPFGSLPSPEDIALWRRLFATRPAAEWLAAFRADGVPAEPVADIGKVFTDPQVEVNGYVVDVDHPRLGRIRQAAAPYVTEPPSAVRGPAPAAGGSGWRGWAAHETPTVASEDYPDRPLTGLKVLDLGSYLAGPFAPMMLSDLGADVIKLEPPAGERMRAHELLFIGAQRGKRSLALDITRPESRATFERLVRWADVVHHNVRISKATEMGIDEASLRKINPDIVYCHVSSYGPRGPQADWPGYDPVAQAASGWMIAGAGPGNPPLWHRFGMMDHQTALASLVPTLLALYQRTDTGRATGVSSSLLATAVMTNSETLLDLTTHEVPPVLPVDADLTGLGPYYRTYAVGDEHIAVAATRPEQRRALCEVAEVEDAQEIGPALAGRDATKLLVTLAEAGVPAELVRLAQERPFLTDAENQRLRLAVSYQHGEYGALTQPGAFWDFGDLSLRLDRPPPTLGEHSREILLELGLSEDDVHSLSAAGVIAGPGISTERAGV